MAGTIYGESFHLIWRVAGTGEIGG